MARPRIVLTMIVRNEAAVIRRCLESVKRHVDAWAISDTGSTDGTQEIIRDVLRDVPGVLIERPWVDFATNRNEAIEAAQQFSPDYCLTLDADEELTTSAGFSLGELSCDTYDAMFQMGAGRWPRKILFRPHLRYKYVLDETLELGETHDVLPACLVISRTDGARSAAGLVEKYRRDCEVLRRALDKEPNEPRYWFYLAQRLMGAGQHREAIEAFEKRIAIDASGFAAERPYSQMMIGQCLEKLGEPFEKVRAAYLKAWDMDPGRAEPLYLLACVHSVRGEHPLAELYARAAQRIQRPVTALPVDESVYSYRAADLMAGAMAEQGKLSEALDVLTKLRALPQVPVEEHARIDENIALLRQQIGADAPDAPALGPDERTYQNQANLVRQNGLRAFRRMGLEFLNSFQAQSLPSPVRWLWIVLLAIFGRALPWAGAVASVPLAIWAAAPLVSPHAAAIVVVASSPLLLLSGRRLLQDAPVAALMLAAVGFAARGEPVWFSVSLFALVSVKEAGALALPACAAAWGLSGAPLLGFGAAVASAAAASLASLLGLFGATLVPVLRAGLRGHATPYAHDHQGGAWHRLLVDLVIVSPVTTLVALFAAPAWLAIVAAIVAAHALAPIRNVRFVIAADLALRVAAVSVLGWWAAPIAIVDLYISDRLRPVYDPVTAALTSQLGMSR